MLREIKFKAWLPGIGKMTYAHTLEELMNWNTKKEDNGTAIWLQYTGLKDIHGNEIYEGDIVRFMYNSLPEQTEITGPVKFDEYNLSWKFGGYYIEPTPRKTIEVIGHIYDKKAPNPE